MGMFPHTGLGARRKTHGAKTCDRWPEFVPATAHAGVRVRILFLWERLKVRPKRLVCFDFLDTTHFFFRKSLSEISQRQAQALLQGDPRFPPQKAPGLGNVRAAPLRVILRECFEDDRRGHFEISPDVLRKLPKRE